MSKSQAWKFCGTVGGPDLWRVKRLATNHINRESSQYLLLIAEFVVDLLCTGLMSEAEYREFLMATLENLSAKFAEKLGRDAPQGLARAAAEEVTGELCAMVERLRADHHEVKTLH